MESRPCCRPSRLLHFPKEEFKKAVKKLKEFLRKRSSDLCMCPRKIKCTLLSFHSHILPPLLSFYYCVLQATVLPKVTETAQSCHLGWDTDGKPCPWVSCVVSIHTNPDQLDCGLLNVYPPVPLVICTKPAGSLNIICKYSEHY